MAKTGSVKNKVRRRRKKRSAPICKWRYAVVVMAVLLVAMLVVGVIYVRRYSRHPKVNVSQVEFPIQGIDVSNHNGYIDFDKVAKDSIVFVYIKASEGVNYKDPRFDVNMKNAKKAGLKVGAYHFFRKDKDGIEQAHNFIKVVKDEVVDMPYVIDVEDWGNSRFASHRETVGNLRAMVDYLEKSNMKIMVYTNKDGYRKYLKKYFPEVRLWLCSFTHPRNLKDFDWHIHQYSHWGVIEGIDGDVDLDVFNGDCEKWERWLQE